MISGECTSAGDTGGCTVYMYKEMISAGCDSVGDLALARRGKLKAFITTAHDPTTMPHKTPSYRFLLVIKSIVIQQIMFLSQSKSNLTGFSNLMAYLIQSSPLT